MDDEHSAIAKSHSSNSYVETEAFTYTADLSEEIAKKFEEKLECNYAIQNASSPTRV